MIGRTTLAVFAVVGSVACATPLHTRPKSVPSSLSDRSTPAVRNAGRPVVGVAFGGGSARGIAHVGVIRWFEEHRIPIDVAAGTSMGGLVGGAFASGMDGDELQAFINSLDWDQLFGASTFAYKNIRRKTDARAFPTHLEFGLKRGIVAPTALNSGASVELLFARVAAPYFDIDDFDALPTPFCTVAVDLLSAQPIILRRGSSWGTTRAHFYAATAGYLRHVTRLPDFIGGPVFAGGWLEHADAFDDWSDSQWRMNGGVGVVMDTLVGPVLVAGSWGFDGRWRTYLAVGRLFR